jgi:hypothetical protein
MEKPKPIVETPKIDFSSMNLPEKPTDSQFDCFGCSS